MRPRKKKKAGFNLTGKAVRALTRTDTETSEESENYKFGSFMGKFWKGALKSKSKNQFS